MQLMKRQIRYAHGGATHRCCCCECSSESCSCCPDRNPMPQWLCLQICCFSNQINGDPGSGVDTSTGKILADLTLISGCHYRNSFGKYDLNCVGGVWTLTFNPAGSGCGDSISSVILTGTCNPIYLTYGGIFVTEGRCNTLSTIPCATGCCISPSTCGCSCICPLGSTLTTCTSTTATCTPITNLSCMYCTTGTPVSYNVTLSGFINDPPPALNVDGNPVPCPTEPEEWNFGLTTLIQSGACTWRWDNGVREVVLEILASGGSQRAKLLIQQISDTFCGGIWYSNDWVCCSGGSFYYLGSTKSGRYGVNATVLSVPINLSVNNDGTCTPLSNCNCENCGGCFCTTYTVTVSGVTNNDSCSSCSSFNTTFILVKTNDSCTWLQSINICSITSVRLTYTVGTNMWTLYFGEGIIYQLLGSLWNCNGSNTMSKVSSDICNNWPATLSISCLAGEYMHMMNSYEPTVRSYRNVITNKPPCNSCGGGNVRNVRNVKFI